MRKRLIEPDASQKPSAEPSWLPLEKIATVELTSEDAGHPIELALRIGSPSEWRASDPGRQVIRICFDQPQNLQRIQLEFNEPNVERTQEYVLRWSADGTSFRDIVRQQFNFSVPGSIREIEDHRVELHDVTFLELMLTPDIGGGSAPASLTRFWVA